MGLVQSGEVESSSPFSPVEINKLYKRFVKLTKSKDAELQAKDILDIPALNKNPLTERVLSIFDKNKDGQISFVEFITGLSTLSMGADENVKLKFAFDVYDLDEDGFISNGDLFKVLKMMIGNNLADIQLQQLVDRTIIKADKDNDGLISFDEFKTMVTELEIPKKLTFTYE